MVNSKNIKILLSNMSENYFSNNISQIKKTFGNLDYFDEDNQSILHILVDNKYDEEKCFLAIKSLLKVGLSPNLVDDFSYNFIQTALYSGYSEKFILSIIKESLKYNLDVNHVDSDKDTIVHTAIYSDDYLEDVEKIYELLCQNGYNSSKVDHDGRNLVEAMIYQNQYTDKQIKRFKKLYYDNLSLQNNNKNNDKTSKTQESTPIKSLSEKEISDFEKRVIKSEIQESTPIQSLSEKEIADLEEFGIILNLKNYISSPAIGREKELKNLVVTMAQYDKNPLIVGESGVGKTALVEELAYRIKTNNISKFLENKIILEINPDAVVSGCTYVGQFEESMAKLMDLCKKYNAIVFIDEIHRIFGIGSTINKNNDMSQMLKFYIDKTNLKVIGTTTIDEYDKYISSNALKRRFEKIAIQEPVSINLYQILDKVINDYSIKTGKLFENENIKKQVIDIIMEATKKEHRVYFDVVNNPDLSISIIDKAFAFAQYYDSDFITLKHFSESFEYCDRIYEATRNEAIDKLNSLDINATKPATKIINIDFKKH